VNEYPPERIKQAEFTCLKCNSVVRFRKNKEKYIAWIANEF